VGVGGRGRGGDVLCEKQDVNFVPRALFPSNGRAPWEPVSKEVCQEKGKKE